MVGGEIYTLWKAEWQKPPKTGEVFHPRLPVLTKTIEILMKMLPGCFGTSQGCHETLEIINFYLQQTSGTAQGSQATGKGNQEFNLGSSTTFATSRTTGNGFPRISASRPGFFKGLSETLALKTVYCQSRTAIFAGI